MLPSHQDSCQNKSQDQYGSNPVRQNFNSSQRPLGNYGSGFGNYSGPSSPYFESTNPYGRLFFPAYRGAAAGYQNNNNNINPQAQAPQPSRPLGPGNRQPLQITNGNANAAPGTNQPSSRQLNNYGNRNPYRPYGNRFLQRPYGVKAYQYDTTGDENAHIDDQEQYEAYEDAFYQGADWVNEPGKQVHPGDELPDTGMLEDTNDNTVEAHFLTEPVQCYHCRHCSTDFKSNNLLPKHLRISCSKATRQHVSPSVSAKEEVEIQEVAAFLSDTVIRSGATNILEKNYAFRGHRFVIAMVTFALASQLYELCFDIGCTMSLIDRKFLSEILLGATVRQMPTPMTVRGLGTNMHDASEYV